MGPQSSPLVFCLERGGVRGLDLSAWVLPVVYKPRAWHPPRHGSQGTSGSAHVSDSLGAEPSFTGTATQHREAQPSGRKDSFIRRRPQGVPCVAKAGPPELSWGQTWGRGEAKHFLLSEGKAVSHLPLSSISLLCSVFLSCKVVRVVVTRDVTCLVHYCTPATRKVSYPDQAPHACLWKEWSCRASLLIQLNHILPLHTHD